MRKQEVIIEDNYEREWWMMASTVAFATRLRTMTLDDLRKTSSAMSDAITVLHNARMRRGRSDHDWWKRGTACLGYLSEKRAMLRQELSKRQPNGKGQLSKSIEHEEKMAKIADIRDRAATDPVGALIALCDVLMHKNDDKS